MRSDVAKALAYLRGDDHESLPDDNQKALVRLLRHLGPLDQDVREALARALDPGGVSDFALVRTKRFDGRPDDFFVRLKEAFSLNRQVAAEIAKTGNGHGRMKGAIEIVSEKNNMSPRTLRDRLSMLKLKRPRASLKTSKK